METGRKMQHSHMRGLVPQLDSTGDQVSLSRAGGLICGKFVQKAAHEQATSMNHCLNSVVLLGVRSVQLLEP